MSENIDRTLPVICDSVWLIEEFIFSSRYGGM
jgi:hypothetical protein